MYCEIVKHVLSAHLLSDFVFLLIQESKCQCIREMNIVLVIFGNSQIYMY